MKKIIINLSPKDFEMAKKLSFVIQEVQDGTVKVWWN